MLIWGMSHYAQLKYALFQYFQNYMAYTLSIFKSETTCEYFLYMSINIL